MTGDEFNWSRWGKGGRGELAYWEVILKDGTATRTLKVLAFNERDARSADECAGHDIVSCKRWPE